MIIKLSYEITNLDTEKIISAIKNLGFNVSNVKTQTLNLLVLVGKTEVDLRSIATIPGVEDVFYAPDDYKLVSRAWRVNPTWIDLGDGVIIGEGNFSFIAGPCSIESPENTEKIANFLQQNQIHIMRGGVFKPRTSPYTFRGHGIEALKEFHTIAKARKIKVITEIMDASQIEAMYPYVDIYQVGTRNAQNFMLLEALGKINKPVLIKRGMSGTLDELLQAAEYVFAHGNEKIILCERGIRTYEKAYRNVLDINAIPCLKEKTHLPVFVDPSHGVGVRKYVEAVTLAAIAAGADGVLLEVHDVPERALSDGMQTLSFGEMERVIEKGRRVSEVVRR